MSLPHPSRSTRRRGLAVLGLALLGATAPFVTATGAHALDLAPTAARPAPTDSDTAADRDTTATRGTTTVSVTWAVDVTLQAAAALRELHEALLGTYRWDERSLRVAALQERLGTTVDGWYGADTRAAHLAALVWTDLPTDRVPEPPRDRGPNEARWEALRRCESGGDYTIVSRGGTYRGAYQFDVSTWNDVARRHHPELVGVDPADASPTDQDAMARSLYDMRGARPWPVCGRHLT